MSTPNFKFMSYGLPLVCGGLEDFEERKAIFEHDYGEEYDYFQFSLDTQFESEEAMELAERFTENLTFHNVTVESGYYYGFQFVVSEKYTNYFDLDENSRYCIDNEDAHYYFDMCRSKALRAAQAEKRKINKWLLDQGKSGYTILDCRGVFSNGVAIYVARA